MHLADDVPVQIVAPDGTVIDETNFQTSQNGIVFALLPGEEWEGWVQVIEGEIQ